jgi:hypothetical protein
MIAPSQSWQDRLVTLTNVGFHASTQPTRLELGIEKRFYLYKSKIGVSFYLIPSYAVLRNLILYLEIFLFPSDRAIPITSAQTSNVQPPDPTDR